LRRSLRAALEAALRALGVLVYRAHLHSAIIRAGRRRVRVLAYHSCEETENDWIAGLGTNTPPSVLESQLDFVVRHYVVVSLDQLERGEHPDCTAVITFDDAYRSVYRSAFPLLRARALPATVYLVTSAVDNHALVWVNELNWFLRRHSAIARPLATRWLQLPRTASAKTILQAALLDYDPAQVLSWLVDLRHRTGTSGETLAAEAGLYLSWDEIGEMSAHGISFGNHTATHPNLARLSPAAQREEMRSGRDALRAHGLASASLAYPFGLFDTASRSLATELGHRSVMEVGGGNQRLDLLRIGRFSPRQATDEVLFAELELVAPVISWLKNIRVRFAGSP
jgi:peptidoglycan/xylan/chitin deacetylase (PgdA/CDA1 family)